MLITAWQFHRQDSKFSRRVLQSITGSVMMFLVAFIFLFNLDWGSIWQVFLIFGGASALIWNSAEPN